MNDLKEKKDMDSKLKYHYLLKNWRLISAFGVFLIVFNCIIIASIYKEIIQTRKIVLTSLDDKILKVILTITLYTMILIDINQITSCISVYCTRLYSLKPIII